MIADEIFRGAISRAFLSPSRSPPASVNEFKWSLHAVDHTFLKGHRIMVEVQSTWFPLYDRNPQTFVPQHHYRAEERIPGGDDDHLRLSAVPIASGIRRGEVRSVLGTQRVLKKTVWLKGTGLCNGFN